MTSNFASLFRRGSQTNMSKIKKNLRAGRAASAEITVFLSLKYANFDIFAAVVVLIREL